MAQHSRSAQIDKLYKVLRKHYKPVPVIAERSVLEHLLFACLLEDAGYEAAETALAALVHTFFDWNEVRVTSISELSEVMSMLPDPRAAAQRIKGVLQSIFEKTYCFDLEDRRKKNLGETQKWLRELNGATPFVVAYVTQAALGGHAIPIDRSTMQVMQIIELASEKDFAEWSVPGLERAIPKNKGAEFASLLHQLGAEFAVNPFSPHVKTILTEISPDAEQRMPKRRQPKPPAEVAADSSKPSEEKRRKTQKKVEEAKEPPPERPAKPSATAAHKPTKPVEEAKAEAPPKAKSKTAKAAKPPASKSKDEASAKKAKTMGERRKKTAAIAKQKPK